MLSNPLLEIIPLSNTVGAEVRCGDVRALDAPGRQAMRGALTEHLVLLLRDQSLDDDALVTFGQTFGELDIAPMSYTQGHKERERPAVLIVSNVKEGGVPIGVLGDAEVIWHSDNSYRETPLAATLLYAVELPPTGGETGFLNMYHALETMPAALRDPIEHRKLKHDATYNSAGHLRRGFQPTNDVRQAPGPWHPIIRTHPQSGHDALYLGRRPNAYIDGLSVDASEDLVNALWAHATREQFAWHHTWRRGDIVVWDNRCVMHHRNPFDPASRRVMHRVQCAGERPFRDPAAANRGEHPRTHAVR